MIISGPDRKIKLLFRRLAERATSLTVLDGFDVRIPDAVIPAGM